KTGEEKASRVEHALAWNFGPVSDLQRSPFFPDVVLAVGGWTFHVWRERHFGSPLLSSGTTGLTAGAGGGGGSGGSGAAAAPGAAGPAAAAAGASGGAGAAAGAAAAADAPAGVSAASGAYLVGGRWSPTRAGVFFISKTDGTVDIWDLLDASHRPAAVQKVAAVAISSLAVSGIGGGGGGGVPPSVATVGAATGGGGGGKAGGGGSRAASARQFLAVADDEGTLHVLEVPKNLSRPTKNEKHLVKAFFDRETRRMAYGAERKQYRVQERGRWEQAAQEAALAAKLAAAAKKPDAAVPGAAPAAEAGGPAAGAPEAAGAQAAVADEGDK
ncbi:WD repeat-containing protein 63, partial [Cladochytrium tenue]